MIPPAPRADELTVQQLRSFCAVYERGSYAEAAADLGLAVPTIWEQVRTLAARYGVPLFARKGRRIEPTPAAAVLFDALRPVLAGVDSSFHLVHEATDGEQTLTVVAGVRMLLEDLGEPLARFHALHPNVRLRLTHGDNRAAGAKVAAGEADLGLTLEPDADAEKPGRHPRAGLSDRGASPDPARPPIGLQPQAAAGRPRGLPAHRRPPGHLWPAPARTGAAPGRAASPTGDRGRDGQQRVHLRRVCGPGWGSGWWPGGRTGCSAGGWSCGRCGGSSGRRGSRSPGRPGGTRRPRSGP